MSLTNLQAQLQNLRAIPPWQFVAASAATGSIIVLAQSFRAYRNWTELGRGGVPFNYFGWLVQATLKVAVGKRDLTEASHYGRLDVIERYKPYGEISFLEGDDFLPVRRGDRPNVPYFFAPQRQTTEKADEARIDQMIRYLKAVVNSNSDQLVISPSKLEGSSTSSIFLKDMDKKGRKPKFVGAARGEMAHVHVEGSSHVTMSLHDAGEVLRKGWGQRHAGSGSAIDFPWTYVLLYAPRNDEEYAIWKKLILATCSFWVSAAEGEVTKITCR